MNSTTTTTYHHISAMVNSTSNFAEKAGTERSHVRFDEVFKYYFYMISIPSIIILGIFGNVCIVIVCSLQKTKSNGYKYIKYLAISDFSACLLMIPWPLLHMIASSQRWYLNYRYGWNFFLAHVSFVFVNAAMKSSTLLTCALTWDRYVALTFPHKYKQLSSIRIVATIITLCFVISYAVMLPRTMRFVVLPMPESLSPTGNSQQKPSTEIDNSLARYVQAGLPTVIDYASSNVSMHTSLSSEKDRSSQQAWNQRQQPQYYFTLNTNYKEKYIIAVYDWIREFLLTVLPLIIIVFLNLQIILKFRQLMKRKRVGYGDARASVTTKLTTDMERERQNLPETTIDKEKTTLLSSSFRAPKVSIGSQPRTSTANVVDYDEDKVAENTKTYSKGYQWRLLLQPLTKFISRQIPICKRGNTQGGSRKRKSTFETSGTYSGINEDYYLEDRQPNNVTVPERVNPNRLQSLEEEGNENSEHPPSLSCQQKPSIIIEKASNIVQPFQREQFKKFLENGEKSYLIVPKRLNTGKGSETFGESNIQNSDVTNISAPINQKGLTLNHIDLNKGANNNDDEEALKLDHSGILSSFSDDRSSFQTPSMPGPGAGGSKNFRLRWTDRILGSKNDATVDLTNSLPSKEKKKSRRRRKKVSVATAANRKYERDEKRLTSMLISVAIQYFVCCVPQAITALIDNPQLRTLTSFRIVIIVTNVLEALNYMLNFYVYLVFVPDFPKYVKKLLGRMGGSQTQDGSGSPQRTTTAGADMESATFVSRRSTLTPLQQQRQSFRANANDK